MNESNIEINLQTDLNYIKNELISKTNRNTYIKFSRPLNATSLIDVPRSQFEKYWSSRYGRRPEEQKQIMTALKDLLDNHLIPPEKMLKMIEESSEFGSEKQKVRDLLRPKKNRTPHKIIDKKDMDKKDMDKKDMDKKDMDKYEKLAEECSGSYWNYRWIKKVVDTPKINDNLEVVEDETDQEVYYELHEVYYNKEEKPFMWTEEPVKIYTEDTEELMELIGKMLNAALKKVLIIKNEDIKELNEYMLKSEILKNKIKEKRNAEKARRN